MMTKLIFDRFGWSNHDEEKSFKPRKNSVDDVDESDAADDEIWNTCRPERDGAFGYMDDDKSRQSFRQTITKSNANVTEEYFKDISFIFLLRLCSLIWSIHRKKRNETKLR